MSERKYNIGDKVKIQTQNDKGWVWYDCEIIDRERKQVHIDDRTFDCIID